MSSETCIAQVNSAEHASGGVVNAEQRIHTCARPGYEARYPTVDQGHMTRVAQVLAERSGPNERSREVRVNGVALPDRLVRPLEVVSRVFHAASASRCQRCMVYIHDGIGGALEVHSSNFIHCGETTNG